jgi:hypothetical protein
MGNVSTYCHQAEQFFLCAGQSQDIRANLIRSSESAGKYNELGILDKGKYTDRGLCSFFKPTTDQ